MAFFKLTLAYDGAEFSGWQAQPGRRTVEGELERAWLEITGETVRVAAASRTDAGVHAAGQVVSIESATELTPDVLLGGLNAKLPLDAVVRSVELASDGFHATHDAQRKRYRYSIYNCRQRPLFLRHYAWHVPQVLDVDAMYNSAQALVGTHDFASFQSVGSERESTVRTIFAADVKRGASGAGQGRGIGPGDAQPEVRRADLVARPSESKTRADASADLGVTVAAGSEADAIIAIEVEGDGFLYNMVRAVAGTLVEVGRGRRDAGWVADVIAARDRSAAGPTAPPHGLTLLWVRY